MPESIKAGQKYGDWILLSKIGHGGNGEVWTCRKANSKMIYAIKLLTKTTPKAYQRFKDEIVCMIDNQDIPGMMKVYDKLLPEPTSQGTLFYVMDYAENTFDKVLGYNASEIVVVFIEIAKTLKILHSREISHRDIKTDNILMVKGKWLLSDFGLVDYPEKSDVSDNNEIIGPKWTIAPEMKRNSSSANGLKADVYSLAKTLWIALTSDKKCFEGQYIKYSSISLPKLTDASGFYIPTSTIDELLLSCTDNNPDNRPSIDEMLERLIEWKIEIKDFHISNISSWKHYLHDVFPSGLPESAVWKDVKAMVSILSRAAQVNDMVHMFIPGGGGLDLDSVRLSHEPGCITINGHIIVKPLSLEYEGISKNLEYNYFRLNSDALSSSGVYSDEFYTLMSDESPDEPLLEMYNPSTEDYKYIEYSDEIPYYDGMQVSEVARFLNGSFVFFCKRSPFNLIYQHYDGRHSKLSSSEFRSYAKSLLDIKQDWRDN